MTCVVFERLVAHNPTFQHHIGEGRAWWLFSLDHDNKQHLILLTVGPVAQWIRHRPTEPGIVGSSPTGVSDATALLLGVGETEDGERNVFYASGLLAEPKLQPPCRKGLSAS